MDHEIYRVVSFEKVAPRSLSMGMRQLVSEFSVAPRVFMNGSPSARGPVAAG